MTILAHIEWNTSANGLEKKALESGRFLIGSSPICDIFLPPEGNYIFMQLEVSDKKIAGYCTNEILPVYIGGHLLAAGSYVNLEDSTEIIIGKNRLKIVIEPLMKLINSSSEKKQAKQINFKQKPVSLFEARKFIFQRLMESLDLKNVDMHFLASVEVKNIASFKIQKIIEEVCLNTDFDQLALEKTVLDEMFGLGPLEDLLADPKVTEIMVNRFNQIYIERAGKLTLSTVSFSSEAALLHVIERIVSKIGRRIDTSSPIVDARLADGSRVNAVIPPLALRGSCVTIRRFSKTPIQMSQLVEWGSLTQGMNKFLDCVVGAKKNLMISGGTGSGKTTLLNALSSFIPEDERIVTIEDAAELQLQQPHVVSLETRPPNLEGVGQVTIRDLVKNSLRMRPDRIIVGECRGAEALDMLQAMNTGHDGSMTTAHANSPEDMLRRVETMVMMAGMDLPLRAIREQIVAAVNVIVQQNRTHDGRRAVTEISWIKGLCRETLEYKTVSLFKRNRNHEVEIYREDIEAFLEAENVKLNLSEII